MSSEHERLKEILAEAAGIETPEARAPYLDTACGDDAELRARVERLLEAHTRAGDFLEQPAILPAEEPVGASPGTIIGRYKLLEEIGEGAFGRVFMAEQTEPVRRKVALKIIKAGMDSREVIARFEAERQALALMDHPNIARVLDVGATESGRPYFVMELVRGLPITDYCDQINLATEPRLQLFLGVCQAVQHAHQKGIIHRDLKPANVLVTEIDGEPVPKIIDFGVAKALGQQLTEKTLFTAFQQIIGTPAYMSPEQAALSSVDVDTRSDIYSLGVLLYELLTGVTPFDAETLRKAAVDEIRRIIRETEPPKPSTRLRTLGEKLTEVARHRQSEPSALARLVHGDLDWIVMKALEKDRSRRYETTNGLAQDIERHLAHEPVAAGPPGAVYRARKWLRRHRMGAALAASVTMALVAGTIISTWQAIEASHARAAEKKERLAAQDQRDNALVARQAEEQHRKIAEQEHEQAQQNLYYAHIRLAHHDWKLGQVNRMLQSLEAVRPDPGEPDLRGWEWYYLLSLCHKAQFTLRGHTGNVHSVSWSPDGRRVASAGADQTIRIWDAQTGQEIRTLHGHTEGVLSAAWSPDGTRIASSSVDGTVRVWDPDTGRSVRFISLVGVGRHQGRGALAWSPDGERVALAGDRTVQVLNAATGAEVLRLPDHRVGVLSVGWSPDGRYLASGENNEGSNVRIWDATTGTQLQQLRPVGGSRIYSLTWSADGRHLASASDRQTVAVWETSTWTKIFKERVHQGNVYSVSWSPHGLLASASDDGTIKVLNPVTKQELMMVRGHTDAVNSVAWSPNGLHLASASRDATVRLWDVERQQDAIALKEGSRAAWRPDGVSLAIGGKEGIALWDIQTWTKSLPLPQESPSYVWSLAWSADGQHLAAAYDPATVSVWFVDGQQEVLRFEPHTGEVVRSVAWRPNAGHLATSGTDNTIRIWDVATTNLLRTLEGHEASVGSVAWSPDGRRLASASWDQVVKVWDVDQGRELLYLLRDPAQTWGADGPNVVAWSPEGDRLAAGTSRGEIIVWDADTGAEVVRMKGHSSNVRTVSWSPDGRRLASGSEDCNVKIWDAETGFELLTLQAYSNWVLWVAWSPNGQMLVTPGTKVWDATFAYELGENMAAGIREPMSADMRKLVASLWQQDRGAEAEQLADCARTVQLTPDNAEAHYALARALLDKRFTANAMVEYRETIRLDPEHSSARYSLGEASGKQGNWTEAESAYREAIRVSPDFAKAHYALGSTLSKQGKRSDAIEAYREAIWLEPDNLDAQLALADALHKTGDALRTADKWTEAEAALREALAMRRKLLGNDHREVDNSLGALAGVLQDQERFAEAVAVWREELALERELPGDEHPWVANSLISLADVLEAQGNFVEAEEVFREAVAMRRKLLGTEDPTLASGLARLVDLLLKEEKFAEAEPPARECLEIREKVLPDNWLLFNAQSLLGASLLGQEKYAEAEPLLLHGYEGLTERQEQIAASVRFLRPKEALQRVVQLYEDTGRPAQAAEWKQELEALEQSEAEDRAGASAP